MPIPPAQPIRVLLVDDHKTVLWGLGKLIEAESPRMELAGKASTRAEALAAARVVQPHIVLLDLDLNGSSSLEFLPDLLGEADARVIILTGLRDTNLHDEAILKGASGVVMKEEPGEVIVRAVERVHEGELWLDRATAARVLSKLGCSGQNPHQARNSSLTPKEREVVTAMVHGGANTRAIAERLQMSEHTLRNHLSSIYVKLEVKNRVELVSYALQHGLASRPAPGARGN